MTMTEIDELRMAFTGRQNSAQTWAATVAVWLLRVRTRRHLRALEKHRLADVGLTETQRCDECAKWFWQK